MLLENLDKIADILAIPFFLLATIYFYNLKNKNPIENLLLMFCAAGFLLDTFFTYLHLNKNKKNYV